MKILTCFNLKHPGMEFEYVITNCFGAVLQIFKLRAEGYTSTLGLSDKNPRPVVTTSVG